MRKIYLAISTLVVFTMNGQNPHHGNSGPGAVCPVTGKTASDATTEQINASAAPNLRAGDGTTNRDWWPNQLDLSVLRQHSELSDPMGEDFNYAEAFNS